MDHYKKNQKISRLYDTFAQMDYDSLLLNEAQSQFPRLLAPLLKRFPASATVLDLGCGTGNLKEYSHFAKYTGVDVSSNMLAKAKKMGYSGIFQSSIQYFISIVEPDSFDLVVSVSNFYFLTPEELQVVLARLNEISRLGWIITLDGVTKALEADYAEAGIPIFNHMGCKILGEVERFTAPAWYSTETKEWVEAEIVMWKREVLQ